MIEKTKIGNSIKIKTKSFYLVLIFKYNNTDLPLTVKNYLWFLNDEK